MKLGRLPVTPDTDDNKSLTVFCKMPHGIRFDIGDTNRYLELVGSNGEDKGTGDTMAGFGITRDIEASVWDAVVAEYGHMKVFTEGFIVVKKAREERKGKEEVKEKSPELKNGFEALDQGQA